MSDVPKTVEPTRAAEVKTGDTVVVGCKLPNGLILQLSVLEDVAEALPGGFRTVRQSRRLPETFTLRGTAIDIIRLTDPTYETPLLIGGYALTPGIPKDFWDQWVKINKDSEIVRRGLVYAMRDDASARARAREGEKERSGLEPIDPNNPGAFAPDIRNVGTGNREAA